MFDWYINRFGGLPLVGDLPAGLLLCALWLSPAIIALWKGQREVRFATIPAAIFSLMMAAIGAENISLLCWIAAWGLLVASLAPFDRTS
jgi:hypothetical protein